MTVWDLFLCMNTDVPEITIYNNYDEVIYTKPCNKPIAKLKYYDSKVAWIYKADSTEISLRIENDN